MFWKQYQPLKIALHSLWQFGVDYSFPEDLLKLGHSYFFSCTRL